MTKPERDPQTGQLLPGHSLTLRHGLYSLKGKGPAIRGNRALRRRLDALEAAILGELPSPLGPRRMLLVNQVMRAERLMGMIELYLRQHNLARPDKLRRDVVEPHPIMALYVQAMTAERDALRALGLDDRAMEKVKPAFDLMAEDDKEKAKAGLSSDPPTSPGEGIGS